MRQGRLCASARDATGRPVYLDGMRRVLDKMSVCDKMVLLMLHTTSAVTSGYYKRI